MSRRRSDRRGFTLIEIMVGLVLLTIGALSLAAMSATVANANRDSTNRTRADQLLHEKVEELQSMNYGDIESGDDDFDVGDIAFTVTWTVENDTPVNDVKQVTLVANWTEEGRTLTMRTATLIAKAND